MKEEAAVPATVSPLRVLVAKPGLDGHDRGAKVGARLLRDAGMEVIYTGLRQTPQQIAEAALQEDVDVIVMSVLSGAHVSLTARLMRDLRSRGLETIPVVVAGTVPEQDMSKLRDLGAAGVFPTGSPYPESIRFIQGCARKRTTA